MQETEDPYSFGLLLGDMDLHLFNEGRHFELGNAFGAQTATVDGVKGVRFAVWAPNAARVAVVGDFNSWDRRRHPMRLRHKPASGNCSCRASRPATRYKYDIVGPDGDAVPLKADPVARQTETPPATASIVAEPDDHRWHDYDWMAAASQTTGNRRADLDLRSACRIVAQADRELSTARCGTSLTEQLVPYLVEMGFTHVELLPITEHPFGGSWGYQPLSLFAPSGRYGPPRGFAHFVEALHAAGIGIILDWVPAHFPTDPHGLARFDGTALYEHVDPREGFHHDWNTFIYNLGRREVQGFLIASALFWLEHFHVDGLRVDAVASMLYRDYSRKAGEWIPNIYGGRENLEAIGFLRHLNAVVAERCPGAITIAEESTAWPGVSRPIADGGLGFSYKWNMGWMHDTLSLHGERADPPAISPRRHDLRPALRLYRKFHSAAVARRSCSRQKLADRQNARRSLAALCQSARVFWLHVDASGQEIVVHGRRIRAGSANGTTITNSIGRRSTIRRMPACRD